MKVIHRCLTLAIVAGSVFISGISAHDIGTFFSDEPVDRLVDRLMTEMTDEEKVAQVFLVGWDGVRPSAEIMEWITTRNIGGVKVFGWNGENVHELARSIGTMQTAAVSTSNAIPLFVATDQEGGWVRHIKGTTSPTPGNIAIGATNLPDDAYRTGYYIGLELRAIGVNLNFAPTVDVYVNPEAHVIGPRAFSDDPVRTGVLGTAYFRGLDAAGVIATAKHFPGHGNADGDSHGVLPVLTETYEELAARDLIPYTMLISEGIPAVLSGHLSFPNVTGNDTPASISSVIKRDILRNRLGFDGLVITDDMYMGGAIVYGARHGMDFAELCYRALAAGSDMLLLAETPAINDAIWSRVFTAYTTEPSFRTTIDASVRRILRTKIKYLHAEDRVPLVPDLTDLQYLVPTPDGERFFIDHAFRSTTIVRSRDLPLAAPTSERVLIVGADPAFFREARRAFPGADTYALSGRSIYFGAPEDKRNVARLAREYDTVIFRLAYLSSLDVLRELEHIPVRVVVLSVLTPVYLRAVPWVSNAVAVYGMTPASYEAGFAAIQGRIRGEGRLPISSVGD